MTTPAFALPPAAFLRRIAAVALWAAASLPFLLLASLLLLLVPLAVARAEEPSCGGENLLERVKADDPELYGQVLAEGAGVANGKGLFWKVERPGLAPSYLLGTMHVTDPRVLKMPPGANEALAKARTVVIESDEILDEKKAMAAILTRPELTMFTDGSSIESRLPADDLTLLAAGLKERGIPISAVSRMKPWMLASFVSLPACELARKAENRPFLDKKIALDAIAAGKPVKGLETLAEQLATMTELPMEFHLQALIDTVKLGDQMDDVVETMTALYLAGETGLTIPMLKAVTPANEGDESAYADFEEAVIDKRNERMAARAAPMLAEGGIFIAVGALHLPGSTGLVELLRQQGFAVSKAD